jgi:116 kDa U5 small nuclear ribonucleoprotein component
MLVLQIMDMLVEQTHDVRHQWRNNERGMRFTDTRLDEQQRGVSLKMVPMTLVMEGSSGKSYVMNLVDTPGARSSAGCAYALHLPSPRVYRQA